MAAMRRDVFQGIADPTRRDILIMIAQKLMNLNCIAENFEISRPAVSQHIKILTECDLIIVHQRGRERYCEPKLETLHEVAEWIEPFKELWEAQFSKLDDLLETLKSNSKNK